MVDAQLHNLMCRLRIKIKNSGLESDDYRIIIYIENYIVAHGKKIADDTLAALHQATGEREIFLLTGIIDNKPNNELIYNAAATTFN